MLLTGLAGMSASASRAVHTAHDSVLRLLPQPKRFRLQVNASWKPGEALFSSCFMRPAEIAPHIREIRPDALVIEALQRFAVSSGRDLVAIVRADARGTSPQSNLAPAEDADAVVELVVEPGISCVQQSDKLSLLIRAVVTAARNPEPILDRVFGAGVKTGMRTEMATNPNQHAPLYASWAKSEAGAIYWAILEALLEREW